MDTARDDAGRLVEHANRLEQTELFFFFVYLFYIPRPTRATIR